ncbi:UNVERIFIED_CONTAM: hypothetical protein FKN15_031050 [Acipenser sinensis]
MWPTSWHVQHFSGPVSRIEASLEVMKTGAIQGARRQCGRTLVRHRSSQWITPPCTRSWSRSACRHTPPKYLAIPPPVPSPSLGPVVGVMLEYPVFQNCRIPHDVNCHRGPNTGLMGTAVRFLDSENNTDIQCSCAFPRNTGGKFTRSDTIPVTWQRNIPQAILYIPQLSRFLDSENNTDIQCSCAFPRNTGGKFTRSDTIPVTWQRNIPQAILYIPQLSRFLDSENNTDIQCSCAFPRNTGGKFTRSDTIPVTWQRNIPQAILYIPQLSRPQTVTEQQTTDSDTVKYFQRQ